jgi:hypothetical protein
LSPSKYGLTMYQLPFNYTRSSACCKVWDLCLNHKPLLPISINRSWKSSGYFQSYPHHAHCHNSTQRDGGVTDLNMGWGGKLRSCTMVEFLGVTSGDLIFSYKRKNSSLASKAYDNLLDLHKAQSSLSSFESSFCQTEDSNATNFFIRVKNNRQLNFAQSILPKFQKAPQFHSIIRCPKSMYKHRHGARLKQQHCIDKRRRTPCLNTVNLAESPKWKAMVRH